MAVLVTHLGREAPRSAAFLPGLALTGALAFATANVVARCRRCPLTHRAAQLRGIVAPAMLRPGGAYARASASTAGRGTRFLHDPNAGTGADFDLRPVGSAARLPDVALALWLRNRASTRLTRL